MLDLLVLKVLLPPLDAVHVFAGERAVPDDSGVQLNVSVINIEVDDALPDWIVGVAIVDELLVFQQKVVVILSDNVLQVLGLRCVYVLQVLYFLWWPPLVL